MTLKLECRNHYPFEKHIEFVKDLELGLKVLTPMAHLQPASNPLLDLHMLTHDISLNEHDYHEDLLLPKTKNKNTIIFDLKI